MVSANGIDFYGELYQIKSTWENISHVGIERTRPPYREGLFLKESGLSFSRIWSFHIAFLRLVAPDVARTIPLGLFVYGNWRETDLGREILKYAPQLKN